MRSPAYQTFATPVHITMQEAQAPDNPMTPVPSNEDMPQSRSVSAGAVISHTWGFLQTASSEERPQLHRRLA